MAGQESEADPQVRRRRLIRAAAILLLAASAAGAASVTRFEFSRSGGQTPGRSVSGLVELGASGGRVTSANGFRRDLGSDEVAKLREALAQPPPIPVPSPDAYTYAVRIVRGKKSRTMTLTDASNHPLVPWLQKETAAISRVPPASR